jgi:hypothetical protein
VADESKEKKQKKPKKKRVYDVVMAVGIIPFIRKPK